MSYHNLQYLAVCKFCKSILFHYNIVSVLLLLFCLQRSDGRFLIGETQPTAAANTDTSAGNAARIMHLAASAVPALSAAAAEGVYVGYRPYPADGYPVVGWLPGCSNAYVAGEFSGLWNTGAAQQSKHGAALARPGVVISFLSSDTYDLRLYTSSCSAFCVVVMRGREVIRLLST